MRVADAELDNLFRGSRSAESACDDYNALRKFAMDSRVFADALEPFISKAYACMRRYAEDVKVQKCATMALASLAEKKGLRWQVMASGGLDQVLAAWNRHGADEGLVKDVLVMLRTVSVEEECRGLLCGSGAIAFTVRFMRAFKERSSIQGHCISLLTNLTFGAADSKVLICSCDGVKAVLDCLRHFQTSTDAKLQGKGCALLRNLCSDCEVGEKQIVIEGGIACLVHAFEVYHRDCDVVEQSIIALRNLARSPGRYFDSSAVHTPLLEKVSRLLVQSTLLQDTYGRAHELFVSLLSAVASESADLQDAVGQSGAISAVINLSQAYLERGLSPAPAATLSFLQRAAIFLRSVAFVAGNRKIVVESKHGVNVLVETVRMLRTEPMRAEQALLAVGNNLFDSEAGKTRFLDCNGICAILSVMTLHPHVSGLQDAGCLSLRAVCDGSPASSAAAVRLGGVEACLHVLNSFPENVILQEHGLAVIIIFVLGSGLSLMKHKSAVQYAAYTATNAFPYSPVLRAQSELLAEELGGKESHRKTKRNAWLARAPSRHLSYGERGT
jgi:hypothetical protein